MQLLAPRIVLICTVGVVACLATGQDADPPQSDQGDLLRQPESALDERIDASKMTESDLPPLPEQVVLPMPPWFHLAQSADEVPISEEHWRQARQAIASGTAFLRTHQATNGAWLNDAQATPSDDPQRPGPITIAITALAMKAIAQNTQDRKDDPALTRAVDFIRGAQLADGSFDGGSLSNYVTASVVMALASLDEFALHVEMGRATTWLTTTQWDQTEGVATKKDWFGGAGYGNRGRPDVSNTQFMLDALYEAHLSPDEPAVQRAMMFMSRAQNLKATNTSEWAGDDGGFIYTPANGGESMASEAAGEGRYGEEIPAGQARSLRSYGSMTYAGFKSLIFAGLSQDDIRVRAAFDWIRRHWTFEENPGLGQQGLFYYYHTMARTLTVAQQHTIEDIDGVAHNWREELIDALLARQAADGSWINPADRWMEGEPVMVTSYAVLALEEALKPTLKLTDDDE